MRLSLVSQKTWCTGLTPQSYLDEDRQQLVNAGAIPVLVGLLNSPDILLFKTISKAQEVRTIRINWNSVTREC
jgi:Armadillo/beta-catenin-like repeat